MALKKRLASDASLRPILAQYVSLQFDLDKDQAEWRTWSSKYRGEGNAIPLVFVVRADGEMLYGKSGSPEELPRFLATWRKQTGGILSPRQAKEMTAALQKIEKAHQDGDTAAAVREIAKFPRGESYAAVVVAAKELATKLVEEGKAAVQKADEQLATTEAAFEGALTLARVQRVYRPMAEIYREARKVRGKHLRERKEVITQGEQIDAAIRLEERKTLERAMSAYQRIAQSHAGTPAAAYVAERIKKLEAAGVKPSATASTSGKKPATTGGSDTDLRRARTYLGFARTLASKRPDRAKDYCRKVIQLAPGSKEAQDAEALLKSLR